MRFLEEGARVAKEPHGEHDPVVSHPPPPEDPTSDDVERNELHNLTVLVLNAVVFRVGWIFKTESVIMPAFLDSVAGAGWLRGMLPVLNRAGQSIPPFLLARRLSLAPHKKRVFVGALFGEALPFLILAAAVASLGGRTQPWLAPAFLALYGIYFSFIGIAQLAQGTLQGKLIRPERRGRLLAVSTAGGALAAVPCAWWLLPGWLADPSGWALIFGMTGGCLALSAFVALALCEPADRHPDSPAGFGEAFRAAAAILRHDRNFRRLVYVAALFGTSLLLFPHYQALARERLGLGGANLMVWVVVQNIAIGVASLAVGPFADRRGNRLTLGLVLIGAAFVPALAIALARLDPVAGRQSFWLLFVAIGFLPMVMRLLTNYTLEIAAPADHPRYLSTLQICSSTPFLLSPLFGLLIDLTSFELVFLTAAALTALGAALTLTLREPRHAHRN
jgi:predicted MFS family arabinose efflux permease